MPERKNLMKVLVGFGVPALLWAGSVSAGAPDSSATPPDTDLQYGKRLPGDPFANEGYRYDFSERHLTLGIDLGGDFGAGGTMNAFPVGGAATPYFRGAFGDGNALEVDLTFGMLPLSGADAEWVFFRTPFEGGTTSGYVGFFAPTLAFRYEFELGASISKRSRLLAWSGIGMGPLFLTGATEFNDNGSQPDKSLSNFSVFFDFVPAAGFRFRLGEFAFVQLGARFHILWRIAQRLNDESEMTSGTPEVINEFWFGNSRIFDVFAGFGYDFG